MNTAMLIMGSGLTKNSDKMISRVVVKTGDSLIGNGANYVYVY